MTRLIRRTALAMGAMWALAAMAGPSAAATLDKVGDQPTALGNPRAPVTVIEYASVTCPHCARFNNDVLPTLKAKYIDTGKVRFVFREYPTEPVNIAAAGFLIARCAGPDRYMTVVDTLFHAQAQLYASRDVNAFLLAGAKAGGLDEAQMKACLGDAEALQAMNARVQHTADVDKIDSTPTVLVNGKRVDSGTRELAFADVDAAIRPLLDATSVKPSRAARRRPHP